MSMLSQAINNEINDVNVNVDVQELLDRVAELESENSILEDACNDRDSKISRLEAARNLQYKLFNSAKQDVERLNRQLAVEEEKYTELRNEYKVLLVEHEELKVEYKAVSDERFEYSNKYLSLLEETSMENKEEATTDEYREVLDDMLEEAAKEVAQEQVKEEKVVVSIDVDKETEKDMNKVVQFIAHINATKIQPILNAEYVDVVDTVMDSIDEAADKYMSMLKKGKCKNESDKISAMGRVKKELNSKKEEINNVDNKEEKVSLLGRLGALVKSILVKAIKVLLATGKIVGKSALILGTLVSKVVVYTVVEVVKAGKAIVTIAVDDYKEVIR